MGRVAHSELHLVWKVWAGKRFSVEVAGEKKLWTDTGFSGVSELPPLFFEAGTTSWGNKPTTV